MLAAKHPTMYRTAPTTTKDYWPRISVEIFSTVEIFSIC